jgi:hypothetical protein
MRHWTVRQAASLRGWKNVEPWSPSMTVNVPPGFSTTRNRRSASPG